MRTVVPAPAPAYGEDAITYWKDVMPSVQKSFSGTIRTGITVVFDWKRECPFTG